MIVPFSLFVCDTSNKVQVGRSRVVRGHCGQYIALKETIKVARDTGFVVDAWLQYLL